ncbi:hypothetical protein LTR70_003924 [Exophiala xenobiotica]|uniref:Major facilitator superfamily (MFS) profile domain-containing protein n=1 Tax=Lithohypha guttulata TaxID=1690604 RepID=A0ABR0KET5_9EURO|nr:hypothetical protein LTR24_003386 [Lithohypha guttulata]KAK5322243.1 hypothetical protein LTR70_003924 [Exophiala xenobiotica]
MASDSKDNGSLQAVEIIERTTNLDIELTAEERQQERMRKWKINSTILPLLITIYFVAQMGRSDLGNAKVAGMDEDLDLSPKEYSNVASIFYVGYLVFQLPGVLLVRKTGPPYLFGSAMIIWGTITTCTVVIHNYASLMVIRVLVGASEAFVSGAVFYLSFWYPYDELATRGAIYFSMAALAGAFNGLIAYAVTQNLAHANEWPHGAGSF